MLGEGSYGKVFLGFNKATKRPRAIKEIKQHLKSDEISINDFRNEINILYNLKHPGIISLIDLFLDDARVRKHLILHLVLLIRLKC